jgi:predicted RNA binding protein YcfA (HicA-like mRNA interferase family)
MKASEIIKLIEGQGWYEVRQRGSHRIFKHDDIPEIVTVPDHGKKDIAPGTLNNILKTAGLK